MLAPLARAALALLAVLVFAPAAMADDITFTGEVTYRERIALPPDAELWITLVTLPGATPIASAAADLPPKAQVPLQYTLNVRSNVVGTGAYGLLAEIRSQGRTLFRNGQPVPVDAIAPAPTLILVNFAPDRPRDPPAPSAPAAEGPGPLVDTVWSVTSIGGDPILPETVVTFSVAADHRAGGNGGCNNYFTEASSEAAPLAFGPIAGTRMACAAEVMAQEAALFAALGATRNYELSGNALKLVDAAGIPLIGLVRGQ